MGKGVQLDILPTISWGGGPAKPVEGFLSVRRARELRKRMSPTEVRLWRVLQTRPGGLRFRKQHPCGPFVFDFYCNAAAVAVEVDGMAHDFESVAKADLRRDSWAEQQGIETIRIAAEEVRSNLEGVVELIVTRCQQRTPPPSSGWSPSPANAGEAGAP